MVNSFYDADVEQGCAFEELISFHGGLGGPQTQPFILHPVALPMPPHPVVGAAAVARRPPRVAPVATGRARKRAGWAWETAGQSPTLPIQRPIS